MGLRLLSALIMLSAWQVRADEKLELTLQVIPSFSPQVRDGQLIGHGRISTQEAHQGYQVWLDAVKLGDAPNQYVITGKNSAQHELRVVIGQEGWTPDTKIGTGIIQQTSEASAGVDIVAQGNQNVPADEYRIVMQGSYIEP